LNNGSDRVLVTGANGFVGHHLCLEILKRGGSVKAVLRTPNPKQKEFDFSIVGNIDERTNWTEAICGVDVVIHLAARVHVMQDESDDSLAEFRCTNTAGTENLARQVAKAGVKRLVYVSSIKVNGEETCGETKFTETDNPHPLDPYGVSKVEAEEALHRVAAETGLEVVIVRPPLVYGAGVKGNFAQMLKVLAMGIPLPLASVNNRRSLVYVGNLVDALILCATHPAAVGQTYLVSDGDDISTPDLLSQLGVAMGHPARLLPCAQALLRLAGRMTGKADQVERLLGSLQVDSGKIRRELGWMPPYTLSQGLRATAVIQLKYAEKVHT
jgi:nucleoside-diphosphate-sugar epimerase